MTLQQQHLKQQSNYINLLNSLRFFFNLRVTILIISTFVLILFTNNILNVKIKSIDFPISSHTKQHINHFFYQAQTQTKFINQAIHKIISLQYFNIINYGQLYYQSQSLLTNVQKITYQQKYQTTGQYTCLLGNCTSIQFYLVNLWAKRNYYSSVQTIYFKYYDPIQNTTNIAYTPTDSNTLTNQQIYNLFLINISQNVTLQKINHDLYFKIKSVFNSSINDNDNNSYYQINAAIKLSKSQMQKILKSDIQLNSYYHYSLQDSMDWICFNSQKSLPTFSYKSGQLIYEIPYIDEQTNNILITFYFHIPQINILFDILKISILLPVLILIFQLSKQRQIYRIGLRKMFINTKRLISLYEYNIQQIFTGKSPKASTILNDTMTTQFYQQLSQIPSIEYQPIIHQNKIKISPKPFLFNSIILSIVQKYNQYAKTIFKQKNKQIISNKFFIHSSVNDISQSQSIKIKQAYSKAKQLGIVKRFFKFAYLSLLYNPRQFDQLIAHDQAPLPDEYLKLMRQINRIVSSTDVRKAFKLSLNILKQTQEQLQMRIQINLLQKYLQILKDLDIHNTYAKQLQLQNDLQNINNYIENIKHVLNKHNKNIRTLGK